MRNRTKKNKLPAYGREKNTSGRAANHAASIHQSGWAGLGRRGPAHFYPRHCLGPGRRRRAQRAHRRGRDGLGNQGHGDFGGFLGSSDVQYVAVCDVRKNVRDGAKREVDERYKSKDCAAYNDFRQLLARDDIEAVHVATPDHWHTIIATEACRHGKDVFCQKPETLTLREGPLMVEYARRYGRVFSGGSQRVLEDYRGTVNMCWGGKLGRVLSINVQTSNLSHACNLPPEPVPEGFDWEMWLGPAPWAPYNAKRCAGDFNTRENAWRAYWDYSGGDITDWGAHHFGGATFAVDVRELQPQEVVYHPPEGTQHAHLEFVYPNGIRITHCKPGKQNMEVDSNEKNPPAQARPRLQRHRRHHRRLPLLCPDPREAVPRHRVGRQHHEPLPSRHDRLSPGALAQVGRC